MLVTEEEAGKRRCPNHSYMGEPHGFCLASMCMAWRWGPPVVDQVGGGDPPDGEGWVCSYDSRGQPIWLRETQGSRGFCGLAGNPTHEP